MKNIRAFIAIELSEDIKKKIHKISNHLKKNFPGSVRWIDPNNIHLTLKFLGDIPVSKTETIVHQMMIACQSKTAFALELENLGVFPNFKRPRVIWVGINHCEKLFALQQEIDNSLKKIGIQKEKRKFNPHLTIGRVKDQYTDQSGYQQIEKTIRQFHPGKIKKFQVNKIILFQSELRPDGPIYSPKHISILDQ